jgi:hypothetical protein
MVDTYQDFVQFPTAVQQAKRAGFVQTIFLLGFLALTGTFAFLLVMSKGNPSLIAWLVFVTCLILILYRPHYGIYLSIFFSLAGDALIMNWYPFTKNLSSQESILYLNDAVIVSPLEIFLLLTLISWLGRGLAEHKITFFKSELFWPALTFAFFIVFGLVYGIGTGGNVNIGLWEARPIFYMPVMLILVNNLVSHRAQFNAIFGIILLAIFAESLVGAYQYFFVLNQDLSLIESLTEHSAAIHINAVIVYWISLWLFKGGAPSKRMIIPVLLPTILLTYIAAQRRAALLSLVIALALMVVILYMERRKVFWFIIPPAVVAGLVYTAVFWNSSSALGMPAQAIKSVIAQNQASEKDQSSNIYRKLENINTHFTIKQAPLTGVGFGQKIFFIVPLPDISFFIWWEYITHNSVLWIWAKTGIGGFISMLVLIGTSLFVGTRALQRMPTGDLKAIALTSTLYLIMHFIYAYVDMSWDNQSMVLVGVMMGISSSLEQVVAHPVDPQKKRYAWQPDPQPEPDLLPLTVR